MASVLLFWGENKEREECYKALKPSPFWPPFLRWLALCVRAILTSALFGDGTLFVHLIFWLGLLPSDPWISGISFAALARKQLQRQVLHSMQAISILALSLRWLALCARHLDSSLFLEMAHSLCTSSFGLALTRSLVQSTWVLRRDTCYQLIGYCTNYHLISN